MRLFCRCPAGFPGYIVRPGRGVAVWSAREPDRWKKAVSEGEKVVGYPTSFLSLRCLLSDELSNVAMNMRKLVGSGHPLLQTARGLLFDGKHNLQTRGLIVLLVSKAAGSSSGSHHFDSTAEKDKTIFQSQRNLAEVIEVIHTVKLIHKGVVNLSELTLADEYVQDMEFGNKMAVLSGDFLLASACAGLAKLNNTKVVEIISSAIADMMEAEFTGFQDQSDISVLPQPITFSDWLQQTYLSSGSLLSKSCKAAMELAGHPINVQQNVFEFGVNMAYAQQLSEDLKPFLEPLENTIKLRLTSAPIVHLAEQAGYNVLKGGTLQDRRKIVSLIHEDIVQKCVSQCREFGEKAIRALDVFSHSDAKLALLNIIGAITKLR